MGVVIKHIVLFIFYTFLLEYVNYLNFTSILQLDVCENSITDYSIIQLQIIVSIYYTNNAV